MNEKPEQEEECKVHAIRYCNRSELNDLFQVQYNQIPWELKYLRSN